MNEMTNVPERDIGTITTEIRTLVHTTQRLLLESAIEIGRHLCEAKSMLPHGEWGAWLKNEVEFSQSSANNFMRIFEEYGADQISVEGAVANSQTFGNLSYSKALRLLAVPAEEREQFVSENNVEAMSTRELDRAIRERDEALRRAEAAESAAAEYREKADSADELRDALRDAEKEAIKAKTEAENQLDALRAAEKEAKEAAEKANEQLKRLRENPEIPPEALEKIRADAKTAAEDELRAERERLRSDVRAAEEEVRAAEAKAEELRKKLAAASPEMTAFKLLFESVQTDFSRLCDLLRQIEDSDADKGDRLRGAVRALLDRCGARLEEINGSRRNTV